MKDSSQKEDTSAEAALDGFLEDVCNGSVEEHGEGFQDRAAVFGFEDGLFVTADRQTYMGFVRRMGSHQKVRRNVEWRQLKGRIASACIVENNGPSKRVSFMTMLLFETGWKIISLTFDARTDGAL